MGHYTNEDATRICIKSRKNVTLRRIIIRTTKFFIYGMAMNGGVYEMKKGLTAKTIKYYTSVNPYNNKHRTSSVSIEKFHFNIDNN